MIQQIALFILLIVSIYWFYKLMLLWSRDSGKTVHWNELLDIEETYSAAEYDRHSDYLRRL